MHKTRKRLLWIGLGLSLLSSIPLGVWLSLTYQPSYYRDIVLVPRNSVRAKPRSLSQSLQLRNDICNEPSWEAVFTDQEVNAWLAEDLVTHFADQLPPEVYELRGTVRAEPDHARFPLAGGVHR